MIDKNFDPWKRVREFNPEALLQESSDLVQWPIKLYKAPKLSPYYHHGHLLIGADCSAFSYPGFHDALSKGRVPLICCPENDFDITVKLADIFSLNDVASVTIVTMDKPCCAELKDMCFAPSSRAACRSPCRSRTCSSTRRRLIEISFKLQISDLTYIHTKENHK